MPTLLHLNGPSGVGKSTLARAHAAAHPGALVCDIDVRRRGADARPRRAAGAAARPSRHADRRSRSMISPTALVARGHHEELELHLRAARTNGLSDAEIKEVLLQSAVYCGVPDANTAFRIAQRVLGMPTVEETR